MIISSNLAKVLIGTAVVAGIGVVAAVMADKVEEKEKVAVVKADDQKIKVEIVEDKSVIDKIKDYAFKKVVKILGFVALHAEQIEAVLTIIGLVRGVIGIASAIKEYRQESDMKDQLDRIEELIKQHDTLDNNRSNNVGKYVQECTTVLNDNLKVVDQDVIKVADKLGVKILEDGEVFAA